MHECVKADYILSNLSGPHCISNFGSKWPAFAELAAESKRFLDGNGTKQNITSLFFSEQMENSIFEVSKRVCVCVCVCVCACM